MTNTIQHILVIRLSAMGDVAMTVPVLRAFKAKYPEVKLTVLTRKFFAPMFSDISNLEIYEADVKGKHKGALGLYRLSKELKELGIDAVADLHNVLRSKVLKSFFAINRIKVVQIDKGRDEKKALTRDTNKIFKQLKNSHERYVDVFTGLGFPFNLQETNYPTKQKLTKKINGITNQTSKKWLGIAPFAQYEGKTYPLELMTKVIEQLDALNQFEILLFGGGKREIDIFDTLESKFLNVRNVAGKLNFDEELILISNLDGMLSMDSGNAHLAAMYGIPTITLWGVTHPYAGFAPFKQSIELAILPDLQKYNLIPTSIYGNKFPQGYEDVMRSIPPETIVKKIVTTI